MNITCYESQEAAACGTDVMVEAILSVGPLSGELLTRGLLLAAERGHAPVVRLLLARRDWDVNRMRMGNSAGTVLARAAADGHAETVRALLERQDLDADADIPPLANTGLMMAAMYGHRRVIEIMLDR